MTLWDDAAQVGFGIFWQSKVDRPKASLQFGNQLDTTKSFRIAPEGREESQPGKRFLARQERSLGMTITVLYAGAVTSVAK
jgi:hypothetical protein